MEAEPSYGVGQVAAFAGVTVRTLHHYDEIGLLAPRGRSEAGYRRYSEADLVRLQQILFYRELGFALDEIRGLVDAGPVDASALLKRQRDLLHEKIARLQNMALSIEHALEARSMGLKLTPEEQFEMFGDHLGKGYAQEAETRWGHLPQFQESQRRAAELSKEEWIQVKREGDDLNRRFVNALGSGLAPDSEEAMSLAEEHRSQLARFSLEMSHSCSRTSPTCM